MKISVIVTILFLLKVVDSAPPSTAVENGKGSNRFSEIVFPRKAQNNNRKDVFLESRKKRCESCKESKRCKIHGKCEFCNIICKDLNMASMTTETPIVGSMPVVTTEIIEAEIQTHLDINPQKTMLNKLIDNSHQRDAEIMSSDHLNDEKLTKEEIGKVTNHIKSGHKEMSNTHLRSRSISDSSTNQGGKTVSKMPSDDVNSEQFQLFLKSLEDKVENIAELIRKTCGQPLPTEKIIENGQRPIIKKTRPTVIEATNPNNEMQKAVQSWDNNKVINIDHGAEKKPDPYVGSSNDNLDEVVGSVRNDNLGFDDVETQSRFKGEGIVIEENNEKVTPSFTHPHVVSKEIEKLDEIYKSNIDPQAVLKEKVEEVKNIFSPEKEAIKEKFEVADEFVENKKDLGVEAQVNVNEKFEGKSSPGDQSAAAKGLVRINLGKEINEDLPRNFVTKGETNVEMQPNLFENKFKVEEKLHTEEGTEHQPSKEISVDKIKFDDKLIDQEGDKVTDGIVEKLNKILKPSLLNKGLEESMYVDKPTDNSFNDISIKKELRLNENLQPNLENGELEHQSATISGDISIDKLKGSEQLEVSSDIDLPFASKSMDISIAKPYSNEKSRNINDNVEIEGSLQPKLDVEYNKDVSIGKMKSSEKLPVEGIDHPTDIKFKEIYVEKPIIDGEKLKHKLVQDISDVNEKIRDILLDKLTTKEQAKPKFNQVDNKREPIPISKEIYIEKSLQPIMSNKDAGRKLKSNEYVQPTRENEDVNQPANSKQKEIYIEKPMLPILSGDNLKNNIKQDVTDVSAKLEDILVDDLHSNEKSQPKFSQEIDKTEHPSVSAVKEIYIDKPKSLIMTNDKVEPNLNREAASVPRPHESKLVEISINKLKSNENVQPTRENGEVDHPTNTKLKEIYIEKPQTPIVSGENLKNKLKQDVSNVDSKIKDILIENLHAIEKFEPKYKQKNKELEHPPVSTIKDIYIEKPKPTLSPSGGLEHGIKEAVNVEEQPYDNKPKEIDIDVVKYNENRENGEVEHPNSAKFKDILFEKSELPIISVKNLKDKLKQKVSDVDAEVKDILNAYEKLQPDFLPEKEVEQPSKFKEVYIEKSKPPLLRTDELKSKLTKENIDVDQSSDTTFEDIDKLTPNEGLKSEVDQENKESNSQLNPNKGIQPILNYDSDTKLNEESGAKSNVEEIPKKTIDIDVRKYEKPMTDQIRVDMSKVKEVPPLVYSIAQTVNDDLKSLSSTLPKVPLLANEAIKGKENFKADVSITKDVQINPDELVGETLERDVHEGVAPILPSVEQRFAVEESTPNIEEKEDSTNGVAVKTSDFINKEVQETSPSYGLVAKLIPQEISSDRVIFVSDGMKLPFNLKKHSDGSYHLAMDIEKLCESCNNDAHITRQGKSSSHVISKRESNNSLFYSNNMHKKRKPLPTDYKKIGKKYKLSDDIIKVNQSNQNGEKSTQSTDGEKTKSDETNIAIEKIKLVNDVFGWLRGFIDPKYI